MIHEMKVSGLTIDPVSNAPIMILKSSDGKLSLPIWIGLLEATAIATELESVRFSRPMTHDLFKTVMENLDVTMSKIEVCDLKDNTFYATIYFQGNNKEFAVDARPSDAIALALRMGSPIYVHDQVIQNSKSLTKSPKELVKTEEGKKWTEVLENLASNDFGKYKM
ncbi:MAG: bifunctional nuclease family protein [Deltaproteobacteria bacterium]|nr:bifunctional nuclease family protein [Deltaproteobacteria bacterium]